MQLFNEAWPLQRFEGGQGQDGHQVARSGRL